MKQTPRISSLPVIAALVFVTGAVMADPAAEPLPGESVQPQSTEASPRSPGDAARAGRGTPGNQGGPSTALPNGVAGSGTGTDAGLAKLDLDRSGKLSRKEAQADAELGKGFKSLDRNRDGQLDRDEYALYGGSDVPAAPSVSPR